MLSLCDIVCSNMNMTSTTTPARAIETTHGANQGKVTMVTICIKISHINYSNTHYNNKNVSIHMAHMSCLRLLMAPYIILSLV